METETPIESYRGFDICAAMLVKVPPHLQGFWRASMREQNGGKWQDISCLGVNADDAMAIGRQCVDYDYRVKVWEFLEGKEYDVAKDGFIPANG